MKTRSKKAKGSRLEKFFAGLLVKAELDQYARRMPGSGAFRGLEGDLLTRLPIHVECKNQKTWSPLAYYRQCSLSNPVPARKTNIVVMGKGGTNQYDPPEAYVFLKAEDFVNILYYAIKSNWPDG